jgi:hypothetical protein
MVSTARPRDGGPGLWHIQTSYFMGSVVDQSTVLAFFS